MQDVFRKYDCVTRENGDCLNAEQKREGIAGELARFIGNRQRHRLHPFRDQQNSDAGE